MTALTTQQKYDEASSALHQLRLGKGVVSVTDQNGEKVTFQSANIGVLQAYCDELAIELGLKCARSFAPLKYTF
jgi:hypothetical protein